MDVCSVCLVLIHVYLLKVQEETKERAKAMLQTPPILPERNACGQVIEIDENLNKAVSHRIIFTETSQHKENQVFLLLYCSSECGIVLSFVL